MSHALPRATRRSADHQRHFTRSHAPIRASHASPWWLTRSHAPLQLYDVMMMSLPTFSLTRFLGTDPNRWPDPNRLKKKKKKMLWPSGPLTLTKKSKFSKRTCPTQFFEYIPILGPISSFETQKLCKCPVSKSWLLHKCWPKSKNFQKGLSYLIFRVDSIFGVYFFIWESEIAQIVWFYNCWP